MKKDLKTRHTVKVKSSELFGIGFNIKTLVVTDLKELKLKLPFIRIVSLTFFCLLISGCIDPEFRLDQSIRDAIAQAKEGNTAGAINKLESLQEKFPQNAYVAEALGIAYQERGDSLVASNYYLKAARLSPEKKHLQLNAAKNLIDASMNEDGAKQLKEYLESFPEDGDSWLLLGKLQYDLDQKQAAVDALTRGILLTDPEKHSAKDHQILGCLYLELGDFPQADYYLNKAIALSDSPEIEAQALLGLIESSVDQEDWDVADVFLKRLESTDRETYDSDIAKALKVKVVATQALKDVGSPPKKEKPGEQQTIEPSPTEEEATQDTETEEIAETETTALSEDTPAQPSEEVEPQPNLEESETGSLTAEDITVTEPGISTDEEAVAEDSESSEPPETPIDLIPETEETVILPEALDPYQPPENEAGLLLISAKQLIIEKDYPHAIRMTWDSINRHPESPAAWFLLSCAYSGYGQYLNAESAALEAVRLNPNNKKIVLHYLGVLQHSQNPERFHLELLQVYHRFNKDPDFILALARSYARIKNDPDNASALYRRFLDLVPDHERAAEVRAEIPYVE